MPKSSKWFYSFSFSLAFQDFYTFRPSFPYSFYHSNIMCDSQVMKFLIMLLSPSEVHIFSSALLSNGACIEAGYGLDD
jgi:hypothetical protein